MNITQLLLSGGSIQPKSNAMPVWWVRRSTGTCREPAQSPSIYLEVFLGSRWVVSKGFLEGSFKRSMGIQDLGFTCVFVGTYECGNHNHNPY